MESDFQSYRKCSDSEIKCEILGMPIQIRSRLSNLKIEYDIPSFSNIVFSRK